MDYVVQPTALKGGTVRVPGDKSISHRALILGAIAEGRSRIEGFLSGADCLATLKALEDLGVSIDQVGTSTVLMEGVGLNGLRAPSGPLDLGNSGTGMRLLAGLLCAQGFDSTLTGDDSLKRRPMQRIIDPLEQMGARIESDEGNPPLDIHGGAELVGIHYTLPVASAQVKSAILLAGLYARGETAVMEPEATRDHTERMLRALGAGVTGDSGHVRISGVDRLEAMTIDVPRDLSSAAFLILAALGGKDVAIRIPHVGVNPTRTGVIEILREMGANISIENARLAGEELVADISVRSSFLHGISVDSSLVSRAIDEFPILFIAAAVAIGSTQFSGIGELRVKESDRIKAMAEGLREMGIEVDETEDWVEIRGGELDGGTVDSFGDHRVAMSFAVAGTFAKSTVRIRNADAVDTSFPGFVDAMTSIGADLRVDDSGSD